MKKMIQGLIASPDFGNLVFRLFIGLSMAFAHGLGKLPPPDQLIEGVGAMGFPAPLFFAWAAALSEFLGALLIALGLYTRVGALFMGFTMAIAAFKVHAADPYQVKELAHVYFFASILIFFQGGGRFSFDRWFRKV